MEKYLDIGEWILGNIESKKMTKKAVYDAIGVTQAGFDRMIKTGSITLKNYISVCIFLGISPAKYFSMYRDGIEENVSTMDNTLGESIEPSGKSKEVDTETKEFYQRQIESLTQIILNLSKNGQS